MRRVFVLYAGALAVFAALLGQLALISGNKEYAASAWQQCQYEVQLGDTRGDIFDCRFEPLTNTRENYYTLASPGDESYHRLFGAVTPHEEYKLYNASQGNAPFLVQLQSIDGVPYVFTTRVRYRTAMPACHLVGHLNSEGVGVAGVEAAFEDVLCTGGTRQFVRCATTAWGNFIEEYPPHAVFEQGTGNGVMLTVDSALQAVCEGATADMERGCVLLMECATGRVRACVSRPAFDPNNIAASIQKNDTSLINRTIHQYNVGSVFKPLLAAAALENGWTGSETYTCTGSITVDGHTFNCAGRHGHGEVAMQDALAQSCNCYFIWLGQQLGADALLQAAQQAGFGQRQQYAGTLMTARGNLPSAQKLQSSGELAEFCFGQGSLLATPLQIAAYMNVYANRGVYISPTLVEALVNADTREITQSLYAPQQRRACSKETATAVRRMLVTTVDEGIARSAKPAMGGAGGKTGTAQTGRFSEDGEEELDAWFAGFWPAVDPQYTIVVMMDTGRKTSEDACAVFRHITNALAFFQN